MKKRFGVFASFIILLFSVFNIEFQNVFASGNNKSVEKAISIIMGKQYSVSWGKVENNYEDYYYKFNLSENGIFTIKSTIPKNNNDVIYIDYIIYNSTGKKIYKCNNGLIDDSFNKYQSICIGLAKGDYYLKIEVTDSNYRDALSLRFNCSVKASNYCEIEPNDSLQQVQNIQLGKKYVGYVGVGGGEEDDYYRIKLDEGKIYKLAFYNFDDNGDGITELDFIDTNDEPISIESNNRIDIFRDGIKNKVDESGMNYTNYKAPKTGYYTIHFKNLVGSQYEYSFCISDVSESKRYYWKKNTSGWWVEDENGWYPNDQWLEVDGVWYYFKPDGYMAQNEYYNGYWLNNDGSWADRYYMSWKKNSNGWWIEDISGWWPSNSWYKIDGYWYYFDKDGYMVTNQYIDGWWIGQDGICY